MEVTKKLIAKVEHCLQMFKYDIKDYNETIDKMIDIVEEEVNLEQNGTGPTVFYIKNLVAEHYKMDLFFMDSNSRKREYVEPRQIAMYICCNMTKATLKTIGKAFGGRDHSTVIYAKQTVEDLIDTDRQIKNTVLVISKKITDAFTN